MAEKRILVVNPGATSTKIAVFCGKEEVFRTTIEHNNLDKFSSIMEQKDYRLEIIEKELQSTPFLSFDAVCGRGGLLKHIQSGTYRINDKALYDVQHPTYGEHAANLGIVLANELGQKFGCPSFFVDPVSVDEMEEVARISGYNGMERESFFHALNQKGMARRAAEHIRKDYEELNLIVVHMGGGVSVAAHKQGKVVDVFNVKDDGSFSMDRAGSLPVNALINLCYSGLTKKQVKKMLGHEAGVYSYLGTKDFRDVEKLVTVGNEKAKLIFDALVYQHCKDIGAMGAVLDFNVDAIVLTGGMANSKLLCSKISKKVNALAPVIILPGEVEMESLAYGALGVLEGEYKARKYGELND